MGLSAFALFVLAESLEGQALPGWKLVWSDEFDQRDGSPPDSSKWSYDIGGSGWGNAELQYYTDRLENARIEGGQLLIEAHEESFGGRNHTSARLLTKGKWDWTYGRFETRVKVPSGAGLWPACWMLGSDIDVVDWPNCGEIDVMEQVGRLPKEIFGTIHGPGYSGGDSVGGTYNFVADVADDYHVFAVEWEENEIRWYVDGINYFTATPASLNGNAWVFDHDHFLLLNMAIGGNFAQALDPDVTFPKQFWVDYVRVYVPDGGGGSDMLVNSGLERGALSPWVGYAPGGANENGGYVESTSSTYYNGGNGGGDNVLTHSGQNVAKVFGDFSGGSNDNGFYQDVEALPGSFWSASGRALTHPQDLMSGANTAWIEVSFRDGSDAVLSLHRSPVLTAANVTPGVWMKLEVSEEIDPDSFVVMGSSTSLEAPAGTAKVRYQIVYRQPAFGGGSMYFDDLDLLLEPEVEPPSPFSLSLQPGNVVSWSSLNGDSRYQPQKSSDGIAWVNLGPEVAGIAVNSVFDEAGSDFYQVVETAADVVGNGVANPGFEAAETASHPSTGAQDWTIASAEDLDPSDGMASMTAETSYAAFSPRSGSRMLVMESTTPAAPASVVAPNTNVRSSLIAVDGNSSYEISFHAAHVVKSGGADPQFNLRFYDGGKAFIGQAGYESFSSIGSAWTKVQRNFTTPLGTVWMSLELIQALGSGNDRQWVSLIDDVELLVGNTPGGQTVLSATAESGLEISWETEFGWNYQVEASTDLGVWTDVGPSIIGSGATESVTDLASSPFRLYRVGKVEAP